MLALNIYLENQECEFNTAYNALLQGCIYYLLARDKELSNAVHNEGYRFNNINYKLYTFSRLQGEHCQNANSIVYTGNLHFEIRSYVDKIIYTLASALSSEHKLTIGRKEFNILSYELKIVKIEQQPCKIEMLTPIEFHSRIGDKEVSYTCFDEEFYELVEKNAIRKYKQTHNIDKEIEFEMIPINLNEYSVIQTEFKKTKIIASYGIYQISGDKDLIEFLYYTGLGRRNTQGFGAFELL